MGLHLNELSKRVGVSSSCLSQIENGKAFSSIVTLKKIADTLNSTVGELLGEFEALATNPVIKKEERKFVKETKQGAKLFLLSHHDQNKQMETFLIEFQPDGNSEKLMERHPGQAYCHVLKGYLDVTLRDSTYRLSEGDSIYFNSTENHIVRNPSDENAQLLWIVTPPHI